MMLNAAPVKNDLQPNLVQKYFIPDESLKVRYCMLKAAQFGNSDRFFSAHFLSVACVLTAVVFSLFNSFSYVLQIPCKILLNIAQFTPIFIIPSIISDLKSCALSLLFVSLGVTFVVAGCLFPKVIFTHFAPEFCETYETRLRNENELLKDQINHLKTENEDKENKLFIAGEQVAKLERKIEILELHRRSWLIRPFIMIRRWFRSLK